MTKKKKEFDFFYNFKEIIRIFTVYSYVNTFIGIVKVMQLISKLK